jgi:hypothetical protein
MLVGLGVLAVVAAALVLYERHVWRTVTCREVIVITGETSIRGLLWSRRGPLLVIRNAVVDLRGQAVPADGELVIERRAVNWIQVLP